MQKKSKITTAVLPANRKTLLLIFLNPGRTAQIRSPRNKRKLKNTVMRLDGFTDPCILQIAHLGAEYVITNYALFNHLYYSIVSL